MRTREIISLEHIDDNPWQPRRNARDGEAFKELVASIRQVGLLQTPLVRRGNRHDQFQLAFGHRRVEACRVLAAEGAQVNDWPLGQIEVEVTDLTDEDMAVLGLTENDRRQDVPALDLARAHRRAIDETGLTIKTLAHKLGVARPTLNNNLRVLGLPDVVLERVESAELSMSVAREFLPLVCDEGAHEDVMADVIASCASSEVWTRAKVQADIRYQCLWSSDWGLLEGSPHDTYRCTPRFDVDAFQVEHHGRLHRLTNRENDRAEHSASSLYTCDLDSWDEWEAAAREAQAESAREALTSASSDADGDDDGRDGETLPPRDKARLMSALAGDPVWQGIAALRSEPGPDLPQNDREREALGTRAELVHWVNEPFWKELRYAEVTNPFGWRHVEGELGERGEGVPPWFPDLEECRSCTIGARWTRHGYPDRMILVCTNREHYLEKLQAGEAAYRELLQAARDAEDAAAQEEMELLLEDLKATAPETPYKLLRALVAANPTLEWRHPLGMYHERFSDEPQMVERIRMMLGMEAVPYNTYSSAGHNRDGRTIDPAALEGLSQDDVEHLLAALTVHRLRQRWTATPAELAESSPGNLPADGMSELLAFLAGFDGLPPDGPVIADLYVCWECNNHHIPWEPDVEPPPYHGDIAPFGVNCGAVLEFSGHLTGWDPATGRITRTWDEKPRSHGVQAEIPEAAYEPVEAPAS